MRYHSLGMFATSLLVCTANAQHVDVLVYEFQERVFVGELNLDDFSAREERVFPGRFDNFYSVNSPGFFSQPGDLPGSADLEWDFLPMTIDSGLHAGHVSTLLYWDTDVYASPEFGPPPTGHSLTLYGKDGAAAVADGGDQLVAGHTIETTASNGAIHEHRYFFLDDNGDGLSTTPPESGIYLLAMQLRIDHFEPSAPFFLVWATPESSVLPSIQPATAWVDARVDTLVVDNSSPAADYDMDGDVDGADFLAWQRSDGTSAGLADWESSYGLAPDRSASVTTVPEPAVGTVLLITAFACTTVRRRW